jgi:hypothetical protein
MNYLIDSSAPWIPSPADEMLLMAALAPEGTAHDAGLTWLANVNLATQTEATHRLLPLVHDRLVRDGIDHPAMAILNGVRRKVWCRNQLLFKHAAPAIHALRQSGIDVMLLKGVALTLNYYQDYGLRPMSDFDLMVRFRNVAAAMEILTEHGWKSEFPLQGKLRQNILKYIHAEHFVDNSGLYLDVHWHLSPLCVDPAADSAFWGDSFVVKFDSGDVRLLNPADQLLHVIVHGLTWSGMPGVRWIADSMEIIGKSTELDWNRLLFQTQERKFTLYVRSALNYLAGKFDAAVPRDVMEEMNARPVTSHEKREYKVYIHSPLSDPNAMQKQYYIPRSLLRLFYSYRRITRGAKLAEYKVTVIGYLCASFSRESGWQIFYHTLYKIYKRVLKSMRRLVLSSESVSLIFL